MPQEPNIPNAGHAQERAHHLCNALRGLEELSSEAARPGIAHVHIRGENLAAIFRVLSTYCEGFDAEL